MIRNIVIIIIVEINFCFASNLNINCARDFFPLPRDAVNNGFRFCRPADGINNISCFDECYDDSQTICMEENIVQDAKKKAKSVYFDNKKYNKMLFEENIINTDSAVFPALSILEIHNFDATEKIDLTLEFIQQMIGMELEDQNMQEFHQFQYRTKHCPYNISDICVNNRLRNCSKIKKISSYNGVCNNFKNSEMGSALSPYHNLIIPQYDSIKSNFGSFNARTLSLLLRESELPAEPPSETADEVPSSPNLLFVFTFQAFYHDIGHLMEYQNPDGGYSPKCCAFDGTGNLDTKLMNSHCLAIHIPPNDPFFDDSKQCIEFVRAQRIHDNCKLVRSRLVNGATTAMDGSFIYGTSLRKNLLFRDVNTGKFTTSSTTGKRTFPDARSEQTATLYIAHDIFAAFHDALIEYLGAEEYEKARKIVIAVIQKIFMELLEIAVGKTLMEYHVLMNDSNCYDENIPLVTLAEFSLSAGRYSHDYVPGEIYFDYANGTREFKNLNVIFGINNIEKTEDHFALLAGMLQQPMHEGISEKLQNEFSDVGGDLYSVDVQRERDAGVESYIKYLKYYRATCIESFDDLVTYNIMQQSSVDILRNVFQDVSLIPLLVGIRFECEPGEGILPPTVAQLTIDQLIRLKCGDRHFWTNDGNFSKKQKTSIKMITMRELVCCYAIKHIECLPRNIFLTEGPDNPLEKCVCRSIEDIIEGVSISDSETNT